MKKTGVVCLGLFLAITAFAQDIKIGYVDGVRLIELAPQGEAAKAALESEFKPREQQIVSLRQKVLDLELQIADQETSSSLSNEGFALKQRELRDLRRDIKRIQQELREDLNIRRNEELSKLQKAISKAIIDIAREEKFDLIIQDAVYAAASIDITKKVLDELRTDFDATK